MIKLIYLLWTQTKTEPADIRTKLLEQCAPQLLLCEISYLQMNIADELVGVRSPAPQMPWSDEPFVAQVNVWVENAGQEQRRAIEDILRAHDFDLAGYQTEETLYTEYGENQHAKPRDWPDGERSPGVVAVTCLERPKHIPKNEWLRRWYGRQSPMSEAMQPRSRYVRNLVCEVLTEGAFPYEGIVEETFPSPKHIKDPYLFYGAKTPWQLAKNITTMLSSVVNFLPITRIPNIMMSEYFIQTPFAKEGISTPTNRRP
jgi:hypothetical protein